MSEQMRGKPLAIQEESRAAGRHQSLSSVVYNEMRALIMQGKWTPSSRLPSEAELCKQFNVSRPVVRQALAALRDDGLVLSRQGSGSFVQPGVVPTASEPQVQFPPLTSVADLESFLNFREGIEGEAAAIAARRHTEPQLQTLREVAAHLGASSSLAEGDYEFHRAVAAASGNPFYLNSLESLRSHIMFGLGITWTFGAGQGDFQQTVQTHHGALVEAIAARDAGAARDAMRRHLQWERAKLMTGQFPEDGL
ncbi:FadR/GntR family transcriptional regulator [Devosia geojensis]|uniref:FadR/GntR family transcriptional regulator n=1 Tax=Devosia geojensis TaxID=443610 RepID=UPI000697F170|nr:FCD domain-containing protein [Devosia geojensis]